MSSEFRKGRVNPLQKIKFTGDQNEGTFAQFMRKFKDATDDLQWSKEEKLKAIPSCLKKYAKYFYDSLREDIKNDGETLVGKLSERFMGKQHRIGAMNALQNKIRPGQSVTDYANYLMERLRELFP